jgi:hypothetical protein
MSRKFEFRARVAVDDFQQPAHVDRPVHCKQAAAVDAELVE